HVTSTLPPDPDALWATAGYAGPAAASRHAGRGARDHELVAFLHAVGDLHELIVLHPGLDHARGRFGVTSDDFYYLVPPLPPHRPQRDSQHVVFLIDGDRRRGGQPARQRLVAVVDADRDGICHHALGERAAGCDRDHLATERATGHGVERKRGELADSHSGDIG